MQHETLLVVDFGSQVTQLIARRVREQGVFAEIVPFNRASERIAALGASIRGIVLSGGPSSLYDEGAPRMPAGILEHGVPVLGICYGLYVLVDATGGEVVRTDKREYGAALLRVIEPLGPLGAFESGREETVWMSHGDHVTALGPGFRTIGSSSSCEHAAIIDPARKLWGVQFHPEVSHTQRGTAVLVSFLDACGFARDWSMANFVDEAVAKIRAAVG